MTLARMADEIEDIVSGLHGVITQLEAPVWLIFYVFLQGRL